MTRADSTKTGMWHAPDCRGVMGTTDWKLSRWAGEEYRLCSCCGGVETRSVK